jgi:hypothetical protein
MGAQSVVATAPAGRTPSWLDDYVRFDQQPPAQKSSGAAGASWIYDYISPEAPEESSADGYGMAERYVIGAYGVAAPLLLAATITGLLAPLLAAFLAGGGLLGVLLFLLVQYSLFPEVRRKRELLVDQWRLRQEIRSAGRKLDRLSREWAGLDDVEQTELAQVNLGLNEYVLQELTHYPVDYREIRGIGLQLERRLRAAGILTAADVSYWRVEQVSGIGHDRASQLVKWRQRIEDKVKTKWSRILPTYQASQRASIQRKYQRERQALHHQEVALNQQLLQLQSDLENARQELAGYRDVNFPAYLKSLY